MKLIRAVKRTKLARQILRAPIILITVVLSALLGLSSCGGGESVKSNGDKMMVMPPPGDSRSEHSRGVFVYEQSAGCGLDVGVATGYAGDDIETLERVFFAAYEQCELTGAQNCSGSEGFGTIYGVNCAAIAHGFSGGRCVTESYDGETVSNARRDALSACRDKLGADCEIVLTDCSTTSNEQSYRRTFVARDNSDGSDGSGSDGNSVGAFVYAQTAGCGLGVGVATGYSADDGSAVNNEAIRQCQLTGAQNCGNVGHAFFGTAIGESCAAIAHGSSGGLCATAPHYGESVLSARRDALSDCRNKLGADCEIVLTACSTTSNKQSYRRTFGADSRTGSNSAPQLKSGPPFFGRIPDQPMAQGESKTMRYISSYFTDPDSDPLTITARSSHPSSITVRVSGDDLILTAPLGFPTATVTITVTATDPGGLSVSQRFNVALIGPGVGNGNTGNGNGNTGTGNTGGSPTVRASITDQCNDGRAIHYRYFHVRDYRGGAYQADSKTGSWPGGSEVYVASQFGETYSDNLSCKPGYGVCYGAKPAGNTRTYWGAGINGDKNCVGCCTTCPTSGTVSLSKTLTCR